MFEIGGMELLIILLVALLVLGPARLPGVAVKLASGYKRLKAASIAFQRALLTEVALDEEQQKQEKEQCKQEKEQARQENLNAANESSTAKEKLTDKS